jgi:glycosyltransferase involved in cell wall biosynthesis
MNINFYSPIGYTGYGVAGMNFLKCLSSSNEVALFPIGQMHPESQEDSAVCFKSFEKQETFDPEAPCLKIWHQFDMGTKVGRGKFFAFPFFELTLLNKKEIHHLNTADEIIVTCEWAKTILQQNGIQKKINIVPLGVNTQIFDHTIKSALKKEDKFIFMNIGKWEVRKGHDVLVHWFNEVFTEKDDVELWIEASSSEYAFTQQELDKWHKLYSECKLGNKIKIFPRLNTQAEIAQLMSYADCGIFPTRAEGWNLELLEMMAMNKPVITTNYSAHKAFCDKDNAMLVDIDELEEANDNKYFNGFGKWAKLGNKQAQEFKDYMLHAYKNRINTNPNGLKTATNFSWENATSTLLECISR